VKVVVVGGGIVGAAAARTLAHRGVDVVLVDRGRVAGGTSSAGEGNLLVSDKGPGAELELAQYAARLWPTVVEELAEELGLGFPSLEFEKKGGLVVALTESGGRALLEFARAQRSAGVRAYPVDRVEALRLEPDLNPEHFAAVYYPDDAQVQPVNATQALVASARRAGVDVLEGEPVVSGIRNPDGALAGIRTARHDIRADSVIVAAGPWSGAVSTLLGAPMPVRPRRGMVLVTARMRHRVLHKVYDADYVGAVGSNAADLQVSSVVESTVAGTVLIGSSRQQIGFDARLDVEVLRELARRAVALFPFLVDVPVMRSYGGFRPFMPDHLPVIGADPRLKGLWHAAGHEGAGIGLSLATAEVLADLMLEHAPQVDAFAFSPARQSLRPYFEEVA
jgi:D-hydroxyproline dehydrogenase subunit beta